MPNVVLLSFNSSLAPHANTQRLSYTVPANSKAYLDSCTCPSSARRWRRRRGGVPHLRLHAGGWGAHELLSSITKATTSATACRDRWIGVHDAERDQLALFTADASTGGACIYRLGVKVTEFSAL